MKARLTKIKSNHQNLRTDSVEGFIEFIPEVGLPFLIKAKPLSPDADIRLVWTTPVQSIDVKDANTILFETSNSTYKIELLGYENESDERI